jgi:hypothetical protein
VKEFTHFDEQLHLVQSQVENFLRSVENLCSGVTKLAEVISGGVTQTDDELVSSDCLKMKEAANQIARPDAPHSSLAKLRRDMEYNVLQPIRQHLTNNRNLKSNLELRKRHLLELNSAKKAIDDLKKRDVPEIDKRFENAKANLESAKIQFAETDKQVFEWLYTLDEYKGDVMDSTMQTVKYLQYEFFASAAHAISNILPERIEFRPMVEMVPEKLQIQVDVELEEMDDEQEVVPDFSTRLIERQAKDGMWKDEDSKVPVDPLSLSSLLSQGFDEFPARRALRIHHNDTQAAMEWLVNGGNTKPKVAEEGAVRMPTTIRRIQKLKEKRRQKAEKEKAEREAEKAAKGETEEKGNDKDKKDETPPEASKVDGEQKNTPPPDLLDFDSPVPSAPVPQVQDLLDLAAPPTTGTGYPAPSAKPSNDLVDLM